MFRVPSCMRKNVEILQQKMIAVAEENMQVSTLILKFIPSSRHPIINFITRLAHFL